MDEQEFRQRLSEVAEWRIPKLSATDVKESEKKRRGRGRPTHEELYQDAHEEIFLEIHNGINPTQSPELTRVKTAACICDDCGAHCPNGRKKEKKLYETGKGKKRNWREKCVTCNKSKNPINGKFDLSPQQASVVWTDFLRDSKGLYKTAANAAREELNIKSSDPSAVEDDVGIISYYPDSASVK